MKKLKLISLILVVVMLVSMLPIAGMLSAFAAEGDGVVANDDWFTRETTDDTPYDLNINDKNDLFAFAEKLSEGTSTKPSFVVIDEDGTEHKMTVHLTNHIILNSGWDAISATESKQIATPADTYPIASGAQFAGIFDGHGYVLSGLFAKGTADLGFFGNVPTGYTATVQNVIIKNSFIEGKNQGIGAIFGAVNVEAYLESHARFGKETKGIIDTVFIEASVSSTGEGNSSRGTAGFVGGARASLDVTNSAFVGNVFGGYRGTGGVVGETYVQCNTTTVETYYSASGTYYYMPSSGKVTLENLYIDAYLVGSNKSKDQAGCAGLVGYMNNGNEDVSAKNVILNCTFGTEQFNDDGTEKLTNSKSYTDTEFVNNDKTNGQLVEERNFYNRTAYLIAHSYASGTSGMNNVAHSTGLTDIVFMDLDFTNVYYVKDQANKIKYEGAVFSLKNQFQITINGKLMNPTYNEETGVATDPTLWSFTNWDAYMTAVNQQKNDSTVKLPVLYTNIPEIGYYGEPRMYNGNQLYACANELWEQLILTYFDDQCALPSDADDDWTTTLETKMTGLDATKWTEYGDYLLPAELITLISNAKEAMDMPSATPTIDADWYVNETTDATPEVLVIYNADDLLAFAAAIEGGKTFAGMTVKLSANVTLNAGWDAFAAEVTAPTTLWPLVSGAKTFAGTFDGDGKTISGIYLKGTGNGNGIFGNVATGTVGTVKNVMIENSYVEGNSTSGVGGIFGYVDNEMTGPDTITDAAYVNKTKAVVDNVCANINVYNASNGNGNMGTAGIIGGSRADVEITNTVFFGNVVGGCRGVAAFVGAIRPYQASKDWDGDGAMPKEDEATEKEVNFYLNTITIKNCFASATLEGKNSNGQSFVGGAVGYSNSNTTTHVLENVIFNCVVKGDNYLAGIYGGAWCSPNAKRTNGAAANDSQVWDLTNVYYTLPEGTEATEAMADTSGRNASVIKINGVTVEGDAAAKAAALNTLKTENVSMAAKDFAGWTNANGLPLPTPVFNSFYTGFVGQSVSVGETLSLNIYVKTDGALGQYEGAFTMGDATETVEVLSENMGNNVHKFTLTDIDPSEMGEKIEFSYGEGADKACETSVKDYLVTLLGYDAELASAMLRWGAAAQVVANYRVNALVTDGVEGLTTETDTTAGLTNNATVDGTESADWYIKSVEMFFDKGVMKLKVKAYVKSAAEQQGVSIAVENREDVVHLDYRNMTPVETETRTYTMVFTNFDLASANAQIAMVVRESAKGELLSQTLITDFDDLVADFMASDASAEEKALAKAMHAVGVALAD